MEPTAHDFFAFDLPEARGVCTRQTDVLEVSRLLSGSTPLEQTTAVRAESFVILAAGGLDVADAAVSGFRQLAILPPGTRFTLRQRSEAWLIAPLASGPAGWVRRTRAPAVHDMDGLTPPPDNPRLKMLQSDRMSLNWVRYDGPRDRRRLSPHRHADFSQAGLALEGIFIHHLRTPWSSDADAWRLDVHREAGPAGLIHIPAMVEHTSEGRGPGSHLLVDLFCPPRDDYIAKGWMLNNGDYRPSDPDPLA